MMSRREDRGIIGGIRWIKDRFVAWQSTFSVVSALLTALLALVFLVDLCVRHPGFEPRMVRFWTISYLVVTMIPLVMGRHYPRSLGLVVVAFLNVWTFSSVGYPAHAHSEINALLQLPGIALYLGWFYGPRLGRALMLLSVLVAIVAGASHSEDHDAEFSTLITLAYAVVITGFCFEGIRLVRRQIEIETVIDPLTGALNRHGLVEYGESEIRSAHRERRPLTISVVDFDDFKRLNDEGGHAAGDTALVEAVAAWREHLGKRGIVARSGGDEFVLLLRTELEAAEDLIRDLRARAEHPWTWGAVQLEPQERLDDVIARADAELYRVKRK